MADVKTDLHEVLITLSTVFSHQSCCFSIGFEILANDICNRVYISGSIFWVIRIGENRVE